MAIDPRQLNSLALAYIGDAIYEVYIREYLIGTGKVKPDELHHLAIKFVAANHQAAIIHHWLDGDVLTEEEIHIVKRGRNAKSQSTPKNMSIADYRYATAFEALIGYHYLMKNKERLDELIEAAIAFNYSDKVK